MIYIRCLLFFIFYFYSCTSLAEIHGLKFGFDYVIPDKGGKSFRVEDSNDYPYLIKVHQTQDVYLLIDKNNTQLILKNPSHEESPEIFVITQENKNQEFSVKTYDHGVGETSVRFEKIFITSNEIAYWNDLFEAVILYSKDKAQAAKKFKKLSATLIKNNINDAIIITYYLTAISLFDLEQFNQAIIYLNKIIQSDLKMNNKFVATVLSYKARALAIKGTKQEAIKVFKQALTLFEQNADDTGMASSFNNIGLSYHMLGELKLAKSYYLQALDKYKKSANRKEVANLRINIGGIYFMQGQLKAAIQNYEMALAEGKELNDSEILASTLEMYAWLQQSQGNYEGLLAKWTEILKIRLEQESSEGITRAYRLIGSSYLSYGNYKKALSFLKQAESRALAVTATETLPILLNKIAQTYFYLHEFGNSEKYYRQALAINKANKNRFQAALDYMGLAQINLRNAKTSLSDRVFNSNVNDAFANIIEANAIYRKSNHKFQLAQSKLLETRVLFLKKEYSKASEVLSLVRSLADELGDLSSSLEVDLLQGRILIALNQPQQAIDLLKSVLDKGAIQRYKISNPKYRASYAANLEYSRNLLVETLVKLGHINKDEHYIIQALLVSESGKANSLKDMVSNSVLFNQYSLNDNKSMVEEKLQTLYFLRSELIQKPHFKQSALTKIEDQIQRFLLQQDASFERNTKTNKYIALDNLGRLEQLQKQLNLGELLLAIRLAESKSFMWIIANNSIRLEILPPRMQIEKEINIFYNFLQQPNFGFHSFPAKVKQANDWLVKHLFAPVNMADLDKLVISPHGFIQFLPVSALLDEKNERILADVDISLTPSLMLHKAHLPRALNQGKILVVANPTLANADIVIDKNEKMVLRGGELKALPYTKLEAEYIQKIYGRDRVDLLEGINATKENLLDKLSNSYELIHFATHGFIDHEIPELSGLVLSSDTNSEYELLTIDEITRLKLNASTVVLSACETALGENIQEEGLMGISYAFLAAGSKQIYATLWKIGDRKTLNLIKQFYQQSRDNDDIVFKINDPSWVKYEIL
jgi:CHAT domain-containing protein